MTVEIEGLEADRLLHQNSRSDVWWSPTNIGEAAPGVQTPLGASIWGPVVDLSVRDTFRRMGALAASDAGLSADPSNAVGGIFYGRFALNATFFCEMGNRLPGTSGDAIAMQLLGWVPPGLPSKRDLSRMKNVAYMMPHAMATAVKPIHEKAAHMTKLWSDVSPRIGDMDMAAAQRTLAQGREEFLDAVIIQSLGVFVGVQPVYDQLLALIEKTNLESDHANALMAGQGSHAELDMVTDLWEVSRDRLDMPSYLAKHGFHGPAEGNVFSKVWREDPTPVQRLAARYAARGEEENPANAQTARTAARIAAENEVLNRLPGWQKPGAKVVLKLAVKRIPLRGIAKASYLQALDICRAAARRQGALYVERGVLSDPEDAFFFTYQELSKDLPENAAEIAGQRRGVYEQLLKLDLPATFNGVPEPIVIEAPGSHDENEEVSGIGASGGIVEGTVRYVEDPAFADVEDGEIIVCQTTDPSWASVLFLASALVVDIGGLLSHAAVVARELGVPCVIGCKNGTKVLRTGDRIRVDGNAGTVEILERAAPSADDVETPA